MLFEQYKYLSPKNVLVHNIYKNAKTKQVKCFEASTCLDFTEEDKMLISDCRQLSDMRQNLECQCLKLKCLLFTAQSGQTKTNKRELTFMACLRCLLVVYCWIVDGEQKD